MCGATGDLALWRKCPGVDEIQQRGQSLFMRPEELLEGGLYQCPVLLCLGPSDQPQPFLTCCLNRVVVHGLVRVESRCYFKHSNATRSRRPETIGCHLAPKSRVGATANGLGDGARSTSGYAHQLDERPRSPYFGSAAPAANARGEEFGRRDWDRTNDLHHVKVAL
jgi:hypothetical protein